MTDAINLCRFTDTATADATIDELEADPGTPIQLAPGVTLHAGQRYGAPCIVVRSAGADDLSAVVLPAETDTDEQA